MQSSYQSAINELNDYLKETYGILQSSHHPGGKNFSNLDHIPLDDKTKSILALSLGISIRCKGCISEQAKKIKQLNVSKKELLALLGMVVSIGGGASLVYAADALEVYNQNID